VKTLIAACLLLALTSFSHAETCIGRIKIDVTTNNDGLNRKGDRVFNVGGCALVSSALEKKVLHICPMGSWCRVVGSTAGDADIESIDSVTRIDPYQQGIRDWRGGQCFRARPYLDNSPEQAAWIRGYHAGAKKYPKRDMTHCHPGSIKGLN
jgi:hypothetical protein